MASLIYLRLLERLIERLKDPYSLNDAEKAKVDAYLDLDELVEVIRRKDDILLTREEPEEEPDVKRTPGNLGVAHALDTFWRDVPGQQSRAESAAKRNKVKREKGFKNPTAYATDAVKARYHTEKQDEYVERVREAYERIIPEDHSIWEHKGVWSVNNLPRPVDDWERAAWPLLPTSRRQATIEVLSEKLDRLRKADDL